MLPQKTNGLEIIMQHTLFDAIDEPTIGQSAHSTSKVADFPNIDLSFFLEPPDLTKHAILKVTPVAPISLNSEQPGTYYQSLYKPTYNMLYGLLENALGIHLHNQDRKEIITSLRKKIDKRIRTSDRWKESAWIKQNPSEESSKSGFFSILQFHIGFREPHVIPPYLRFTDLWARHVHSNDTMFPNGSRNHDYTMDRIQSLKRSKQINFSDLKNVSIKTAEQLQSVQSGDSIHPNAVRPWYPAYYTSPTPREYIDATGAYQFPFASTPKVIQQLKNALQDPQAPLYLGSNDGWVEVTLEKLT
ncbi:MAG: type I-PGING CRISPR-associated protein Cas5p [Rhodothermia bacterium]|nr:type I-PGING CRISPR-associated protein Cas5p [Rhodothermia bacterium]